LAQSQNLPLPTLDYDYDALEPFIDEQTMRFHHLKHHRSYTDQLNSALSQLRSSSEYKHIAKLGIDVILSNLSLVPDAYRDTIRNNGGGYVNHDMFWKCMTPNGTQPTPNDRLSVAITDTFGSFDNFKSLFTQAALNVFGSGWAWLYLDRSPVLSSSSPDPSSVGSSVIPIQHTLVISSTSNQDTPVMDYKKPILALDVWEHAYYLKYQNRRREYVQNWWQIVNWRYVEGLYNRAVTETPLNGGRSPKRDDL